MVVAFTFVSSKRKTKSQIQYLYYNFCLRPKAFAKSKDSNKCSLSDWPSFFSFEKRIPQAYKGRREHERKVNDAEQHCKLSEVPTKWELDTLMAGSSCP